MARPPWIGRPLTRREDLRLVRGQGRYLDDLAPLGEGHLAFVRSPLAHARIRGIDAGRARSVPGVRGIWIAGDLPGPSRHLPRRTSTLPADLQMEDVPMPLLAIDEVRFAGEAVAAVLADSRESAEDSAELVGVALEPLAPVSDPRAALRGGPPVHPQVPDNQIFRWRLAGGPVGAGFAEADLVVRASFSIPRLIAVPLEPRGCLAAYSPAADLLTLWCSSEDPHQPRAQLAELLGRSPERVRVVVPDVGGAFGSKAGLAPEHALAALLAMETGCPVRWVETRSENFLAAYQGRGMEVDAELALKGDGRMLALRSTMISDAGAYLLGHTPVSAVNAAVLATGAYLVRGAEVTVVGAATNKVPAGPYRGAGRPEAALVIERLADLAAAALRLDPIELRRRNLIPSASFPHRTALGHLYDSGDYAGLLERALELADFEEERRLQEEARAQGRRRGVGVAVVVTSSGQGLWEAAEARLAPDGQVLLLPGSSDHGQGHGTTFAQLAADAMGIAPTRVVVRSGDSSEGPLGQGTFASRSTTIGGSAVLLALEQLQERCESWAAFLLDVPEEELLWREGGAHARSGEVSISLSEIARAASARGSSSGLPDLEGEGRFTLPGLVFGSSACVAVVEVDGGTGSVRVTKVVSVDDAGTVVNPLLAEGQIHGATAQGIASALFEEAPSDPNGQPLATSLVDYAVPTMPDLDHVGIHEFRPTRSPLSPHGAKGVAEAGCIAIPPALSSALSDALSDLGELRLDPPYTPEKVWRLISGAPARGSRPAASPTPSRRPG